MLLCYVTHVVSNEDCYSPCMIFSRVGVSTRIVGRIQCRCLVGRVERGYLGVCLENVWCWGILMDFFWAVEWV